MYEEYKNKGEPLPNYKVFHHYIQLYYCGQVSFWHAFTGIKQQQITL